MNILNYYKVRMYFERYKMKFNSSLAVDGAEKICFAINVQLHRLNGWHRHEISHRVRVSELYAVLDVLLSMLAKRNFISID